MKSHKIIVRHLPPTMTEQEFLKQTEPLPENDFYYYAPPDWSLGRDATCRAYITVKNYDDILLFRDRFDGYVFVDNRGNEYPAIVEFAPFQGVLKNKCRNNELKIDTIESEPHYQNFLKKLEKEREALAKGGEGKLEFNLDRKKEEVVSTPLLEYLANKKEKRREEARKHINERKYQKQQRSYGKQGDAKNRKDNAPIASNYNANGSKRNTVEKENNKSGTQSKRRNDRRAERNRRRSEDFKRRLQEQHMRQQQQQQQQQQNDSGSDNDEQKGQSLDKNGNRNYYNDKSKNREKDSDRERERRESTTTTSDDYPLNSKPEDIIISDELSDSVRNFIYQATQSITLPIPSKCMSAVTEGKPNMINIDNILIERQQGQQQKMANQMRINEDEGKAYGPINTENDSSDRNRQKQQERRDEKRIRNKDRPSIAIYQPKARLRMSEENDNSAATGKETLSQSTSDCENVITKDETHHSIQQQQQTVKPKRVQRYSERTKNRQKNQNKDNKSPDNMEFKKEGASTHIEK